MTQASWVWEAWVARATPGSATFSEDTAATTAARARQTTAVMTAGRAARGAAAGVTFLLDLADLVDFAGLAARRFMADIACSQAFGSLL